VRAVAGQDQAAPAGVGLESLGDDVTDDRGRDDQEPGVVVERRGLTSLLDWLERQPGRTGLVDPSRPK